MPREQKGLMREVLFLAPVGHEVRKSEWHLAYASIQELDGEGRPSIIKIHHGESEKELRSGDTVSTDPESGKGIIQIYLLEKIKNGGTL